jgi:RNA polymerase sigma factor (TIGR02999 family)
MDDDRSELAAITQLRLKAGAEGEGLDEVFAAAYPHLRQMAEHRRRRWSGDLTLGATALVHEAYMKVSTAGARFRDRGHFFAVAATAMRQILINYAEKKSAQKRGGGARPVTLHPRDAVVDGALDEVLALDQALKKLEELSPRQGRVVERLFFAGYGIAETAEALHSEALEILEGLHGRQDPNVSAVLSSLAGVAMASGDKATAEARYREALRIDLGLYADIDGGNHPGLAVSYFNLGRLLKSTGDTDEAERLIREAMRIYRVSRRTQPDMHATVATFLGSALREQDRASEAEALFREAIGVLEDAFGPGTLMEADAQVELAALLATRGETGQARRLLESALASYAPFLAGDHARVRRAREALAGLEG